MKTKMSTLSKLYVAFIMFFLYAPIVVMIIFSIILGYGAGAIDTGLNNFISLHYEARHMNWLHCCWGLGVTISPLIMSAFLSEELSSWRMGYRIVALLQLSITAIIFFSIKKWDKVEKDTFTMQKYEQELAELLLAYFFAADDRNLFIHIAYTNRRSPV